MLLQNACDEYVLVYTGSLALPCVVYHDVAGAASQRQADGRTEAAGANE
jgi:hypothetical protein